MIRYAFDLDCTLTLADTYQVLADAMGLTLAVEDLTQQAMNGQLDFPESLRRRFALMSSVNPRLVRDLFDAVPLDPDLTAFINARPERCAVITNNLDIWMTSFTARLSCRFFAARARWTGERTELLQMTDKEAAALAFKADGKLVAIGDSLADLPMFKAADFSIQHAAVHSAPPQVLAAAQRRTCSGKELKLLLEEIEAGLLVRGLR